MIFEKNNKFTFRKRTCLKYRKVLMELFSFYNVENLFLPDPKPVHKLDPTRSGLRNWDERDIKISFLKSHMYFS
jgi:hypothetical protein